MYETGFVIFCSTVVSLRDLDVCFVATSKLYDWRRIQIDMSNTKMCIFRSKQNTVIKLRDLEVCFIATSKI